MGSFLLEHMPLAPSMPSTKGARLRLWGSTRVLGMSPKGSVVGGMRVLLGKVLGVFENWRGN